MAERAAGQGEGDEEAFERWQAWALAQAERIDPSVGAAFLKAMDEPVGE